MVKKSIWAATLILASATMALAANVELKLSTPRQATLSDNFCLHVSPDVESDTVMCLNAGAPMTLVARMKYKGELEGKKGYWYKAEIAGGAEGWVFDAYLDIAPASDEGNPDGGPDDAGDSNSG